MDYFYSFTKIPFAAWLIIFGISSGLLAVITVSRRLKGTPVKATIAATEIPRARHLLIKTLKLIGFGIFSLGLITITLMLVLNYQQTIEETLPTPSQVEIPADLPFEVEEISFLSSDGLRMSGWFVPPHNGATIILLHGYGANRLQMRWHAEKLVEAGYGVLMYDERASGESEGNYRSYGWEDERDITGAIDFLNARAEVDSTKIGIGGCSIGAQIALQGAAYHPEIGAVWADGASLIRAQDNVPSNNPLLWLITAGNYMIDWQYVRRLKIEPPAPMIEIIDEIAPRPIMLVAGGLARPLVGSESRFAYHFAKYAGDNAEVWVIKEAFHCDGPGKRPEEYAARMVGFFDAAFGVSSSEFPESSQ
jgi:pimeloyl-ACP methyl ester carboxylesterase